MLRGAASLCVAALVVSAPRAASADANDLVLSRLALPVDNGPAGMTYVPQNADFRALASQLGVVLAPHMLTPADTLGFGGFQFTIDFSSTQIDPNAAYWRALQSSPDPRGTGGMAHGAGTQETVGFFVRKGMWFPVPAFEVGAGAVHLVNSRVWTGQLYTKLSLHEGYHRFPLPSLAIRGGVSRMMNQNQLDLTVASLDATVSKRIGIGGTWRLDPYLGFNLLMIIPRSEVIDPTPNVDPLAMGNEMDATNSFVFKDQDNIYRNRFLVGMKFQYYVVQATIEATFATAGSSLDDRPNTTEACTPMSTTVNCDAKDTASGQRTISFSLGVDF
jgi:hypothetical protein